jgi:hypothetical protein
MKFFLTVTDTFTSQSINHSSCILTDVVRCLDIVFGIFIIKAKEVKITHMFIYFVFSYGFVKALTKSSSACIHCW